MTITTGATAPNSHATTGDIALSSGSGGAAAGTGDSIVQATSGRRLPVAHSASPRRMAQKQEAWEEALRSVREMGRMESVVVSPSVPDLVHRSRGEDLPVCRGR